MKKIAKLIFITPLPPPVTGQSLISQTLLEELSKIYEITIIDYSRDDIKPNTGFNISQLIRSIKLASVIKRDSYNADLLYLTLSMSFFGNLKDMFFLFRAGKRLRKRTIIHIHSGGFDKFYKRLFFINKIINKYFLGKVSKGIVLGKSLKKCLSQILPDNKIEYVPNFYDDKLLSSINDVNKKWNNIKKINLLFLSNFIKEKGYIEFFEGYKLLPEEYKSKCNIVFAGKFDNEKDKELFFKKITLYKKIKFYNFIENEKKKEILFYSQALFLPTYYEIEGQPVCILEAYAAGLTVFTTDQGGIGDIFTNGINGEFLEKRSILSIKDAIIRLIDNPGKFKTYALNNRKAAEKYSKEIFIKKMLDIFNINN